MRRSLFYLAVAIPVAFSVPARADSEIDRLREALRTATSQARALEDQRAAIQAKLTAAEQERDKLRKLSDRQKAQIKEGEQAYRKAVQDYNDRLAERDETLEKWKSAYGEAASVARTKDAERAKFEQEATALKASGKSCEAKNARLVKTANDVVTKFEEMSPLEKIADHDPVFGMKRVEHQNTVQEYRDQILDQKAKP